MKNANLLNEPSKNERSPLRVGLGIAGAVSLAAIILAVFLVTHPATASDGDNSEGSGPPAQSEGLSSATPESQPPARTEPVITTEDPEGAVALEELLDAEQAAVFNAAVDVCLHLFGGATDEVNDLNADRHYLPKWETVEIDGMQYTKSWGPYANYADFDGLIHSVYTDAFWVERNTREDGIEIFTNVNSSLYYISAAMGGDGDYNWDVPDTYRLVEQTNDTILFTIIGHFSRLYPREDGTYGHTLEFPVRMVRTEDGWRVDQLYLPCTDRELLYGWEIQPWTGNRTASPIKSRWVQVDGVTAQLSVYSGEESVYRFVLTYGGEQVEFTDFFDKTMPLFLGGVDLDGDGNREIVITYCQWRGSGVYDGSLRVFRGTPLTEYDCSGVTDMVIGQIESTGDADHFYLQADGLDVTIPKEELGSDEFNRMYEAILLGDYYFFKVAGSKLYCHLGAEYREFLLYCGEVTAELRLEGGALICGGFTYEQYILE